MWAKVDDQWWCHPKVMGLTVGARGLWISALSWSCMRRDPVVPAPFLGMVAAEAPQAEELVAAGLWVVTEHGWRIHDWAEYQELSISEKRAEAGRKGGSASKHEANGKQPASKPAKQTPSRSPDPVPVPDPSSSSSQVPVEVWPALAKKKLACTQGVNNTSAWLRKVAANDRDELGPRAEEIVTMFHITVPQLVDVLAAGGSSPLLNSLPRRTPSDAA